MSHQNVCVVGGREWRVISLSSAMWCEFMSLITWFELERLHNSSRLQKGVCVGGGGWVCVGGRVVGFWFWIKSNKDMYNIDFAHFLKFLKNLYHQLTDDDVAFICSG